MSASPFATRLLERASECAVDISGPQAVRLERYYGLLRKWNGQTNLTALALDASPVNETIDRLFLEPLVAARFIEDIELELIDIGSGGGSPAVPLKIFRPRLKLTMVESRARKAAFLREAVRHLELPDADVLTERAETLAVRAAQVADIVTVRAVRVDSELSASVRKLLRPAGMLLTFGPADVPQGFGLVQKAALPASESFISVWFPQR